MKRMRFLLSLAILHIGIVAALGSQLSEPNVMEEVWKEFRQIHPYGYQTVALKHIGDDCVFVISEPSESITEEMLKQLFQRYGGSMIVRHQPLGYEGWLADAVGIIHAPNDYDFNKFTQELFNLIYGTDYKAYYTDLDNPSKHVYFSENRLNYSISAAELSKWFITDKEQFKSSKGIYKTITEILSDNINGTNDLYYSKERGFVAWIVSPDKISVNDKLFAINARKFALDTDLIIGALGNVGSKVAIIARERVVPVTVLPPLRIETILLLATTENDNLAQSFERYNIFAGKTSNNEDTCPIYLSDELWHTEYGNLLNMTDQMLKSWTENNRVHDYNYDYQGPVDWAFNYGVLHDLGATELTYNWNTAGAGYVVQDMNKLDVFAVNRTGSLPVSFIPDGMEGRVEEKVNDAEELAYDFFSELNSPELVREVQYATIYQIFRYFKDSTKGTSVRRVLWDNEDLLVDTDLLSKMRSVDEVKDYLKQRKNVRAEAKLTQYNAPSFSEYERIVEELLKAVSDTTSTAFINCYNEGLKRFTSKYKSTNAQVLLKKLIQNDSYGGFVDFLMEIKGSEYVDSILSNGPTLEVIKKQYDNYVFSSIDSLVPYFERCVKSYGKIPYSDAAKYIVRSKSIKTYEQDEERFIAEYNEIVNQWKSRVDSYNKNVRAGNATIVDKMFIDQEEVSVKKQLAAIEKKLKDNVKEFEKEMLLRPTGSQEQALGALNWLLTDPGAFDAPIGDFYASKFTSHKQWIKSPPIACSTINIGYGGHNLDAHITPIKVSSSSIPKGYCKVSKDVRGQRVLSVSNADKSRITPAVLRTIERKAIMGNFKLPKAPAERAKAYVIERDYVTNDRGLILAEHTDVGLKKQPIINREKMGPLSDMQEILPDEIVADASIRKQAFIDGKEIESVSDIQEMIAKEIAETGASPVKEIHFRGHTAREVHVYADNLKECIVERMPEEGMSLKKFDINEDIQVVTQGDGTVKLVLEQRTETLPKQAHCKAAMLNISVPEKVSGSLKEAIIKVFKKSEDKINNRFKWKRELKQELQKEHPEIDSYDIKDEFIQLFGHILKNNDYEFIFELAA